MSATQMINKAFLFGMVRYRKFGDIRKTTVFGITVYKAIGAVWWFCGIIGDTKKAA